LLLSDESILSVTVPGDDVAEPPPLLFATRSTLKEMARIAAFFQHPVSERHLPELRWRGNDERAQRARVLYSLVASCKLHGVNPFDSLRDGLARVSDHPARDVLATRRSMRRIMRMRMIVSLAGNPNASLQLAEHGWSVVFPFRPEPSGGMEGASEIRRCLLPEKVAGRGTLPG
jgi:hypothetical protein